LPGQNWNKEIKKAVKNSQFFLPLFSSTSTIKRGYVQREIKLGIDTAKEIPEGQIFIIPIRMDDCKIPFEELLSIQYQDMFPNWNKGVGRIIKTIKIQTPLIHFRPSKNIENIVVSIVNGDSASADDAFNPNPVEVKAGQKVVWTNNDIVHHTITSGSAGSYDSGKEFDSGLTKLLNIDDTFEFTFTIAGEYTYYCQLHPTMNGKVIVYQ
jgi:plastocyanin